MPIDTIGDINLREAELKAKSKERGPQALRTIAGGIGDSMSGALQSAEMLQKNELDKQKQKDAEALLASGAEGIAQYAQELQIQDPTVYMKMAENVKDPKQFVNIYGLMKQKSDKDIADKERSTLLSGLSGELDEAMTTADPDKIAKVGNKINAAKIKTTDPASLKQLESIEKGLNAVRARGSARAKKPGEATKGIVSLRKEFRTEAKDIDEILRQTRVLRSAFDGGSFNGNRVGSDQALIMTFNKILDPTSVVRESEFERTGRSQGVLDATKGWLEKAGDGGSGLTEDGRKAVFKMSELISQMSLVSRFEKIAEFDRLGELESIPEKDRDLIVPGFNTYKSEYDEWKADPDKYREAKTNELNAALEIAQASETGGGSEATAAPEEAGTGLGSVSTQDLQARLAALKAKRGQ